mmetsp:Transcript_7878/g.33138  ORF Transcript_7878/g.33138 Transcript_7878/m.33138 type:complete len:217 (+) Transcript_7878:384-1034(+)
MSSSELFWYFRISRSATVPGLKRCACCSCFTGPDDATTLKGAAPPVDFLQVCLVLHKPCELSGGSLESSEPSDPLSASALAWKLSAVGFANVNPEECTNVDSEELPNVDPEELPNANPAELPNVNPEELPNVNPAGAVAGIAVPLGTAAAVPSLSEVGDCAWTEPEASTVLVVPVSGSEMAPSVLSAPCRSSSSPRASASLAASSADAAAKAANAE